jgi:hypothetical protein
MIGYRVAASSHLPDNSTKSSGSNLGSLILGQWSFLSIAYFSAIDVLINPYQLSSGFVRISVLLDVDVQARQILAFCKCVDIATS